MHEYMGALGISNSATAAATLIDSTFRAGALNQYKRELVVNGVQAKASVILSTALRLWDDEDGTPSGIKAAFVDNGVGMSEEKILDNYGELFNGASDFEAGNFQMGARVATLPWNPHGVIVASWTEGDPDGSMLWITYDATLRQYRFHPFYDSDDDTGGVVGIPGEFLRHPEIVKAGHGTVVILLGSRWSDHTVGDIGLTEDGFIYPDTRQHELDWHYYNAKFWTLPGVTLKFMWGPSDLSRWMDATAAEEWIDAKPASDRTVTYRTFEGVADRVQNFAGDFAYESVVNEDGTSHDRPTRMTAPTHGSVPVVSVKGYPALIHWALFPKERFPRMTAAGGGSSDTRDYGIPLGLFGELHQGEIYNVAKHGETLRPMDAYGISRRPLRDRMVIVVEPQNVGRRDPRFVGVHPDRSRRRLVIANGDLPHDEWGAQFIAKMPNPVKLRLAELNGEGQPDDAKRRRQIAAYLQEFLGRRIKRHPQGTIPVTEEDAAPAGGSQPPKPQDEPPEPNPSPPGPAPEPGPGPIRTRRSPNKGKPRRPGPPPQLEVQWRPELFGPEEDPSGQLAGLAAHLAGNVIYVNSDHPALVTLIATEQQLRREDKSDDIEGLAQEAIGDHLVALVLAARLYVGSAMNTGVTPAFITAATSDAALTAALLNAPTMETLINERFKGRIGFKKLKERIKAA